MENITYNKRLLTGLLPGEITEIIPPGKEKYRGMQIFRWINERHARTFDEMTNLPKQFREELAQHFTIESLVQDNHIMSGDGTTDKFTWKLHDGMVIESVIIRDEGRITACISSQVGCARGCGFCRTAGMGFIRNLTAGEIVDQIIQMSIFLRERGEKITNIVYMGMGEPLDNLASVERSIRIFNMEIGMCIAQRKITVSTCGKTPGIRKLTDMFSRIGLAISLNGPNDNIRSVLMPINKRHPIAELIDAARYFTDKTRRRVTFEYILIRDVNDSEEHARALASLCRRVPSKINLIVFNEFDGSPFRRPDEATVDRFQQILYKRNMTAIIRKSKGQDILASCGQLATQNN